MSRALPTRSWLLSAIWFFNAGSGPPVTPCKRLTGRWSPDSHFAFARDDEAAGPVANHLFAKKRENPVDQYATLRLEQPDQ